MELIWFDFHGECKGGKHANLIKLMDLISLKLELFGFSCLYQQKNKTPISVSYQRGVIRTNCVDCLDRTNVVQSVIARKILLQWLSKLKIVEHPKHEDAF